jgi:hypothetical protein
MFDPAADGDSLLSRNDKFMDDSANKYTFDASRLVELNPLGFKTMQEGEFIQVPHNLFESEKTEVR